MRNSILRFSSFATLNFADILYSFYKNTAGILENVASYGIGLVVWKCLLDYFRLKRSTSLPNPRGPLSSRIPSAAIVSANSQVRAVLELSHRDSQAHSQGKGKKPHVYSPKKRAEIGKLAGQTGPFKAARRFSRKLGYSVNESTARRFKELHDQERKTKRRTRRYHWVTCEELFKDDK